MPSGRSLHLISRTVGQLGKESRALEENFALQQILRFLGQSEIAFCRCAHRVGRVGESQIELVGVRGVRLPAHLRFLSTVATDRWCSADAVASSRSTDCFDRLTL